MKELDDFGKKLEDLRKLQIASESAKQKLREEQLLPEKLAREERLQRELQLVRYVKREIFPILQTVKQRYLLGRGEIKTEVDHGTFQEICNGFNPTEIVSELQKYVVSNLKLSIIWDHNDTTEKKIMLLFEETGLVRLSTECAELPNATPFRFEDKELKNKITTGILSLLENPSLCEYIWRSSSPYPDSTMG